jgi:hypothetical protein
MADHPRQVVGMIDATVREAAGVCPLDAVARAVMSQFIAVASVTLQGPFGRRQ